GRTRRGPIAVQVATGHRHGPVHEVPEVVREIGVVAPQEAVPRHVTIAIERDLPERDVAGAIGPEGGDDIDRFEEVAATLAHPLAPDEQPAMDPDLPRERDSGAHEHRRPHDRVETIDVLADDM